MESSATAVGRSLTVGKISDDTLVSVHSLFAMSERASMFSNFIIGTPVPGDLKSLSFDDYKNKKEDEKDVQTLKRQTKTPKDVQLRKAQMKWQKFKLAWLPAVPIRTI